MTSEEIEELEFAEEMIAKYQAIMLKSAGLRSVSVEGESMSLDDIEAKWTFWKKERNRIKGTKPKIAVIRMGGV